MDKKDLILESIIQEYLKSLEPISSKQLMDRLEIKISSASIRNYFSKLAHEGELDQIHISSGRVPTNYALKRYWIKKLGGLKELHYKNLDHIKHNAQKSGIFFLLDNSSDNYLTQVVNIENTILLLIFKNFHLTLDYNPHYEKFLSEFKNYEFSELIQISKSLGITSLANELEKFNRYKNINYYGLPTLLRSNNNEKLIESILAGEILLDISHGIHFDGVVNEGFMAIKTEVTVGTDTSTMLCIGDINSDFSYFLNK